MASIALIILNSLNAFHFEPLISSSANIGIGLLGFFGIVITLVAQLQMGRSWRIGVDQNEETQLMVNGLYSKSRNPIYFGILLYWLAICLCFTHPAMWACATICWISIELIVRKIEEPYLKRVHGDTFNRYCLRSNRYFIL
jgi:protein-S-isoprenylcysteine O-methyltransferase Ste14